MYLQIALFYSMNDIIIIKSFYTFEWFKKLRLFVNELKLTLFSRRRVPLSSGDFL